MISNLASARALLQADLEHARNVLDLWAHQVAELEKALAQLDEVVSSRDALRGKYQALAHTSQSGATLLPEPARRGRKPGAGSAQDTAPVPARKSGGNKRARKQMDAGLAKDTAALQDKPGGRRVKTGLPAKYKDPQSDKTWSGRGRAPAWLVGERDKYAI